MNRRDFFVGLGPYSLAVFTGDRPPDDIRGAFARVAPPSGKARRTSPEPHMTLVDLGCDVLVAGAGMAGVCAAIAAARHGANVVLVQDRSRLGGNASSEVKMHIVGANCHKGRPGWREGGLIEEFRLDDAANNPQRSFESWDLLLYDKVASEPNITLLLETTLYAAETRRSRITSVMARCDRSEHLYRIRAKLYLDCTGDSRLALEAGAEMRTGREARAEFNESLAPERADNETLGSSILFTSSLHHKPMPFTPPTWARKIAREQLRFRKITSWEYGYWWIEWGGNLDTIRDNERIRFELLAIVMGVWDYIKNSGEFPDAGNWAMDWMGMMPGKRGSRRLVGDVIVSQNDLMKGEFEDAVAIGGWPMDDHPPGGFDRPDLPPNTALRTPEVFNLPLRALYSRNITNLMMAGRNISATHAAFTSTRVMATCAVVGQAAGTAAAMCVREGITPRQLNEEKPRLRALQQALLRDDQSIRGFKNEDALDLARKARVTASGNADSASRIIDGFTREIPGGQAHQWATRLTPDGAWIELQWDEPQRIREVQLTFDSGFQRELTLSAQDAVNRGIVRAPQPETVRDYVITAGATELARVANNHQRLRRHRFDATAAKTLRVHVNATNGDDFARIFEVRCYS